MNQALPHKMRRRRADRNHAPAIRNSKAQLLHFIEPETLLQVQRLRSFFGCSEAVAVTLARLAYGEGRRS